jgi:hypothetical protein
MRSSVVAMLQNVKISIPLLIFDEGVVQSMYQCMIDHLGLSVGLWMECHGKSKLEA